MIEAPATPAATVRHLVRSVGRATLATVLRDGEGAPHASLVLPACDLDGSPILLLSDLADHSKNLAADPRLALLFDGTAGLAEPLAGERASVLGRAAPDDEPRLRARYLARHPSAAAHAGFRDFRIYRVSVERAHLVAGFGRIHWLAGTEVILPCDRLAGLADAEAGIVDDLNGVHADAVQLYATRLLGRPAGAWRVSGVDPDGLDLRSGTSTARLAFAAPVSDAAGLRGELVRLAHAARGGVNQGGTIAGGTR